MKKTLLTLVLLITLVGWVQKAEAQTDPLTVEVVDVNCLEGESVILIISVSGGDDSNGYTVTGVTNGQIGGGNPTVPNPFNIQLLDGTAYNLTVVDTEGTSVSLTGQLACSKCENNSGLVTDANGATYDENAPLTLSSNETVTVLAPGIVIDNESTDGASIGTFIVHTEDQLNGNNIDGILAVSPDGTFTFADLGPTATFGTTYYVYSVVGIDGDNDGIPDFSHECTEVSQGTFAFVFLNDGLIVDVEVLCSSDFSSYNLLVTIIGGTAPYTVSGTISGTVDGVDLNNPFLGGPYVDGSVYNLTVEDADGTVQIVTGAPTCTKGCDAGETPSETVFVCDGDAATVVTQNTNFTDTSAITTYILYAVGQTDNGTDTIGTILDTSATGVFTFANAVGAMINTVYYVSAVVGPDNDGDGFPDENPDCFDVSNSDDPTVIGTPVVFLGPIAIDTTVVCDSVQGVATYTFILNGGLPAFNSDSMYTTFGNVTTTVPLNGTASFSVPDNTAWTFGATDGVCVSETILDTSACVKPSPVSLLSFTGQALTEGNLIKWATATETNNEIFTVKRSTDGINYETIATRQGAGSTLEVQNYSFLDKNAPSGVSYYKLFQKDYDETTTEINKVVNVVRGEVDFGIVNVSPVPATEAVQVNFHAANATKVVVNAYDITGRVISTQNVEVLTGANTYELNIEDFASGVYFISLNNGVQVVTERFVKR